MNSLLSLPEYEAWMSNWIFYFPETETYVAYWPDHVQCYIGKDPKTAITRLLDWEKGRE